jgi:hypothetical protein
MAALPPHPALMPTGETSGRTKALPAGKAVDIDGSDWERRARNRSPSARWIGWRLRGLVLAALLGCLAMFALIRALAQQPVLEQRLAVDDRGVLRLAGPSPQPALQYLVDAQGQAQPIDRLLLTRSASLTSQRAERTISRRSIGCARPWASTRCSSAGCGAGPARRSTPRSSTASRCSSTGCCASTLMSANMARQPSSAASTSPRSRQPIQRADGKRLRERRSQPLLSMSTLAGGSGDGGGSAAIRQTRR